MREKEFRVGDFVFAKVRGFPHWPARIVSIADERKHNLKFNVYFFGTSERASVLIKDIEPFTQNESKYGNQPRRRFFNEAMAEIRQEIAKVEKGETSTRGLPGDDKFREFKINESNKNEEENEKKPEDKSKEVVEVKEVVEESKKDEKDAEKKEHTSRSGRVIKPKRFLYDTEKEEVQSLKTKKPHSELEKKPEEVKKKEELPVKKKKVENDQKKSEKPEGSDIPERNVKMGRLAWARAKNGQMVQIKLDFDRPVSFSDDKTRLAWERSYENRIKRELENIESGGTISDDLVAQFIPSEEERKQMTDEQYQKSKRNSLFERKRGKLRYLTLENRLLEIDCLLKACLRKDQSNPDKALVLLDELIGLPMDALMLKKRPVLVDTARKIRSYTGNLKEWNLTEEEESQFQTKATQIRQKATVVLNKYRSLFAVSKISDFWSVFADSVSDFNSKVKDLPASRINTLIIDPSSPYFKEVLELEEQDEKFMLNLSSGGDEKFPDLSEVLA